MNLHSGKFNCNVMQFEGSTLSGKYTFCHADPFTSPSRECKILTSTTHSFQFLLVQGKGEGEAEESGKHGLEHVGLNV